MATVICILVGFEYPNSAKLKTVLFALHSSHNHDEFEDDDIVSLHNHTNKTINRFTKNVTKNTSINYKITTKIDNFSKVFLIPPTIVTLAVIGFPKTGTSTLMQHLKQFWDLQYWGIDKIKGTEHEFWTNKCFPKKKTIDINNNININTNNNHKTENQNQSSSNRIWNTNDWEEWINIFTNGKNNGNFPNEPTSIGYLSTMTQS